MPKFRKKPVVIEAHQWFKNGDHPLDYSKDHISFDADGKTKIYTGEFRKANNWEGDVVRYFRLPGQNEKEKCSLCNEKIPAHGWIDTLEGGYTVCPGDWIITGIQGEFYPCKSDIFEQTYEKVE